MPLLVSPRAPGPFCRIPLKVVEALSPPAVSIAAAARLLVIVPVPASEPIALEKPLRSKVELTVKSEFALNAVVEPACNVPALTVVAPE